MKQNQIWGGCVRPIEVVRRFLIYYDKRITKIVYRRQASEPLDYLRNFLSVSSSFDCRSLFFLSRSLFIRSMSVICLRSANN
jgi:hypothetical protein